MSNEITKEPEIRFDGYEGDWEQRKVSDLFKVTRGNVLAVSKTVKVKSEEMSYPVYSSQTLNDGLMGYYNEFLFDTAVTWTTDGANAGTVKFRPGKFYSTNVNGVLLSQKGYACKAVAEILNLVAWKYVSRVGNPKLMNNVMSEIVISIPQDINELGTISDFLDQLDNLITLHQRELDLLEQTKQTYLQKMFPKTGEDKPEIRFAGFTDAWEQRKLGEGTSKIGDGLHGTPQYTDDGTVFFINGNNLVDGKIVITKETKLVTELDQSKDDKLLNNDTILMSINGTIGNLAWYNNENVMLGKSAAYLTISEFDKKFIYSYLQTPVIKNYFSNNLTGTTIKNLGLKTIRNTNLFVPIIEEQQKIGSFFKQLDDTIALHQRELDSLKEMKKTLLKKMFI